MIAEHSTGQPQDKLQDLIRQALRIIKENDWVVKEADKNLGLVLMSRHVYRELLSKEIDTDGFVKVTMFPHSHIVSQLRQILTRCNVPQRKADGILSYARSHESPGRFYVIPKIHKPTVKSRPITAQHSYVLGRLSEELSSILNREVLKIPSITVNSKQFIRQLEQVQLPPDCWLLTYDVARMYPSIDLHDAIRTLREGFPTIFKSQYGYWTYILNLIMFNSYVSVGTDIYKQVKGTATGTAVAPAFANLYLWLKYRPFFSQAGVVLNRRYIDDGFVITRSKHAAVSLANSLQNASSLDLEWNISSEEAIYLDVRIFKGSRFRGTRVLDVELYSKPISKYLYLHATSHHPRHVYTGIVCGEMIRYLRNTCDKETWIRKVRHLFTMLRERGYTRGILRTAARKVSFEDRSHYLRPERSSAEPMDAFIVVPYHPRAKEIWTRVHGYMRHTVSNAKIVERTPRSLVFTRSKTIAGSAIKAADV